MARFSATAIDLSSLPTPKLIEIVDYETALAEQKADVQARFEARGIPFDTGVLESETVSIILEATAYREMILRSLVNAKALQTLLAFADGTDLDHIGARFGVLRMAALGVTAPRGNVLTFPADWETDDRFRRRIQLAPDAYSNAGTPRGYEFHVLSASIEIVDVNVFSPVPGRVDLVCLSAEGAPSDPAIMAVYKRVTAEDVKPATDDVRVIKAKVLPYTLTAKLRVLRGPDPALIRGAALTSARAYAAKRFKVGALHYRTALIGALQVGNVESLDLLSPLGDVDPGSYGVAKAAFDITTEVIGA